MDIGAELIARAAYVIAQAALLNCEVQGMIALNTERANKGYTLGYDDVAFSETQARYAEMEHQCSLLLNNLPK
jgi:hypothetical protein